MLRAYALTADENGRFREAAASYEAALLADPADLEATINLAVLYWQATFHSRGASGALPQEFLKHAQKRLPELLGSATERRPSGQRGNPQRGRALRRLRGAALLEEIHHRHGGGQAPPAERMPAAHAGASRLSRAGVRRIFG
jgi:hypothetical protein